MQYPGFVGPSYISQSPNALNARTLNWFIERMEIPGAQSPLALYPTPGVAQIATATSSPGRAHGSFASREFAVIGSTLYEISAGGVLTDRGAVAIDGNPATLSYNGDGGGQVFVTSGDRGYIFDLAANTLTQVRADKTTMGEHLNGYFIALDADTGTIYLSDLLDGTTWDPTQFAQRSIRPDPWVSMRVWDRYLYLFGTETSEVWYDAGTAPFPFAPHPSGLVHFGIAATFSARIAGGALMWVSQTVHGWGDVVRTSGFTPEVVSSTPVHLAVDDGHHQASAIADAYEDEGHIFYVLTAPAHGTSWVYDASPTLGLPHAMRWAERGTWISESNTYVPWRPAYHAFAFGEHRMLDRETGAVYRLDGTVSTDVDGRPLRRLRRPPAIWARESRLFVSELEVVVEPGLGLVSGQGVNPLMALRISTNGGKTFGTERSRSAGALGVYGTRVYWTRGGSAKQGMGWQPEIVCADPIPWRLLDGRIRGTGLPAPARAA